MNVIIFEDEKLNADRLIQLLEALVPRLNVLKVIESIDEGKKWLATNGADADLAFMDIQLSDGNCFELFQQTEVRMPVIFTTAYDKFALQAFKVHSIDYLMKPIDKTELERALQKFSYFKPQANPVLDLSRIAEAFYRQENTRFIGRANNQIVYVKSKDIACIYYADGITKAITHAGKKVPLDYSLDQMDKLLNKTLFFRINRKMIVCIDAIVKINSYYNSRLILQLNPEMELDTVVSRERVGLFKSWLEGRETTVL
ncbi:LytR/AlgR family response regulator transcription factor [Niabella beijingensis]|uniref:LytR/AlgR family response regulator transcription factor n=1 Tax=Niabella beijingensis TaxID=2872700 RepID=UPI001CBC16ED|nr:LytTR family DNA-binding domain-containing protein [Niabella beijingensis]MBZ4192376.1 LytTR family DNA-binding domain-containing protein [Niabella beijingensis]